MFDLSSSHEVGLLSTTSRRRHAVYLPTAYMLLLLSFRLSSMMVVMTEQTCYCTQYVINMSINEVAAPFWHRSGSKLPPLQHTLVAPHKRSPCQRLRRVIRPRFSVPGMVEQPED